MKMSCPFFFRHLFLVAATFGIFSSAHAQTDAAESSLTLPKSVDKSHDSMENKVNLFANRIDKFFGSDRVFEETKDSFVKLSIGQILEEAGKINNEVRLTAQINLPRTQDRLNLLITSEPESDEIAGNLQPREALGGINTKNEQTTALRFIAKDTDIWNIHADTGLRYHAGLDPFARLRVRRTIPLLPWTLHLAETLFWYDSLGRGETTHVDIERPLDPSIIFRATTEATWRNQRDLFDLVQDVRFMQRISDKRSMIYRASAFGESEPVHATDYLLSVRYRQLIHRDWLFFEINPQINYPKDLHYKAVPTLSLMFYIIF